MWYREFYAKIVSPSSSIGGGVWGESINAGRNWIKPKAAAYNEALKYLALPLIFLSEKTCVDHKNYSVKYVTFPLRFHVENLLLMDKKLHSEKRSLPVQISL